MEPVEEQPSAIDEAIQLAIEMESKVLEIMHNIPGMERSKTLRELLKLSAIIIENAEKLKAERKPS